MNNAKELFVQAVKEFQVMYRDKTIDPDNKMNWPSIAYGFLRGKGFSHDTLTQKIVDSVGHGLIDQAITYFNSEPSVPLTEVKSAVIHSIGYNTDNGMLFIRFRSSEKVYAYHVANPSVFIRLLNAEHKGQFYNDHIRGQYDARS